MPDAKFYGAAAQYNKAPATNIGRIIRIAALVVVALILVTAGFFIFKALTSAPANDAARLVARERVLLSFMNTNQQALTSDDLKTVNSTAVSLTTSDGYTLLQGVKKAYDITAVPEEITKSEADTTSAKTLATAKTQSRFDQAYVQLLRDKIAAAQQLAHTVLSSSGGTLKTATQINIDHLTVIDAQLAKLSF